MTEYIAGREVVYSTIMDDETTKALTNVLVTREKIEKHIELTDRICTRIDDKVVGAVDCPICEVGRVGYSKAKNGHIHAACSTPKCVKWAE